MSSNLKKEKEVKLSKLREGRMYSLKEKPIVSSMIDREDLFTKLLFLFARPMELDSIEDEGTTILFKNPLTNLKNRKTGIKYHSLVTNDLMEFDISDFKDKENELFIDHGDSKGFLEKDWLIKQAFEEGTGQTGKRGEGPANSIRSFLLPSRSPKRHTTHKYDRDRNEFAYLLNKNSKSKTKKSQSKSKGGSRATKRRRG